MNREEALKIIEEETKRQELIKLNNPFWFFVPNDGEITPERKELLSHWLQEEDIPQRTDSQLDVLLSDVPIKGTSGGNGSGKTTTGTIDGIIKSTGELPLSLRKYEDKFEEIIRRAKSKVVKGRVTAVDNKQLHRVVLESWKYWTPKKYLKRGIWEESYSKEFDILTLYRNQRPCANVEFLTNAQDVDSSQGGELDWAKFDEEPEQKKYKETLLRFRTADRLDIEIDWTPTKGLSWATDLFHKGILTEDDDPKNNVALFKLTSVCNAHAKRDTLINIMNEFQKVSSYDEMKMRLLGEAISLSGLIYGGFFNRSLHIIKPFTLDYKRHFVVRGLDPHLVKPTYCAEVAVDRNGFEYVVGTYISRKGADTEEIKRDLALRAKERNYRLGWTRCDKSADYEIEIAGVNIYELLRRGKNAIPALEVSDKFSGSIHTGVNEIKKKLGEIIEIKKDDEIIKRPVLSIFDTPENRVLINSFLTLERDTYANEDKKGEKDKILEGKHDAHACLRYINQRYVRWMPPEMRMPVYIPDNQVLAY